MKFGTHEAMEMHEILSDAVIMIDHYAVYISQCRDPELRNILERQQRHMIDEYHRKVNVMQGHGMDVTRIPRMETDMSTTMGNMGAAGSMGTMGTMMDTNLQYGMQQSAPVQPSPNRRTLSDRTIAQGALSFHKCGAVRATNAALECAEPHLRNLLSNSTRVCTDMAYEIFRYMNQRGWYQVPIMSENFVNHMAQSYQQTGNIGTYNQMGH